jgi:hypothetical protein
MAVKKVINNIWIKKEIFYCIYDVLLEQQALSFLFNMKYTNILKKKKKIKGEKPLLASLSRIV